MSLSTPTALTSVEHWLNTFIQNYNSLNKGNLEQLASIYDNHVVFVDPIHEIKGLDNLTDYFAHLYDNMLECHFNVTEQLHSGQEAAIYWKMSYCHRKINGSRLVEVEGHSQLKFVDGKVIYHRDYYDLGELLYEHLPVIGTVIKTIKRKASS